MEKSFSKTGCSDANTRNQHFGMIRNAFIRLVNMDDNSEFCKYDLSENYNVMTGMIVGEVYREGNGWEFNAIGEPVQQASRLMDIVKRFM